MPSLRQFVISSLRFVVVVVTLPLMGFVVLYRFGLRAAGFCVSQVKITTDTMLTECGHNKKHCVSLQTFDFYKESRILDTMTE